MCFYGNASISSFSPEVMVAEAPAVPYQKTVEENIALPGFHPSSSKLNFNDVLNVIPSRLRDLNHVLYP